MVIGGSVEIRVNGPMLKLKLVLFAETQGILLVRLSTNSVAVQCSALSPMRKFAKPYPGSWITEKDSSQDEPVYEPSSRAFMVRLLPIGAAYSIAALAVSFGTLRMGTLLQWPGPLQSGKLYPEFASDPT